MKASTELRRKLLSVVVSCHALMTSGGRGGEVELLQRTSLSFHIAVADLNLSSCP